MSVLEEIKKVRKLKGISWKKLAYDLPISGNALRIAFTRGRVNDVYLDIICNSLGINRKKQADSISIEDQSIQTAKKSLTEEEALFIINSIFTHEEQLMEYNAFKTYIEDKEEKAKNAILKELLKKRLNETED